ncbi:CHAT domain-containing protein [Chryseotalea sanaruensis]|uniref:CHAT domain-containing protein n=1 Tax=Chryseotalea sanaruensis TaxID=2482724 RepID=A0A401UD07_9BACT|nr:CHAT domain-containing protein [Chryseotalea sanaruensis]
MLALLLIGVTSYTQDIPKLYLDIESNFNSENYEACSKMEKALAELALQRNDTLVANGYYYIGFANSMLGKTEKAISQFEKEKSIRESLGLQSSEDYGNVLSNLVGLYFEIGNNEKAASMAYQLLENDKKNYGITSDVYVQTVLNTASVLRDVDKLKEAQTLLESNIKQQEKSSANYALLLLKLGDLYSYAGLYSKAGKTLSEVFPIIEKQFGLNSPEYLDALVITGTHYVRQGKYPEAEETFDQALDLLKPEEETYMSALNDQALVYRSLGQLEKAEKIFTEIKVMDSATLGTTHPYYAITLSNLALIQTDAGKYKEAENNLLKTLAIQKANGGTKSLTYTRTQTLLARVYQSAGQVEKAIPLLEQSSTIFKTKLGDKDPDYAWALFNLGMANWKAGKGSVGIKQLKTAASIITASLGKNHQRYAETSQKIAEYQWLQKQNKEAQQTFGEVFNNYYNQIDVTFPVLTEEEKAKFYYNKIRPSFDKFNAFAVQSKEEIPSVLAEVYDHQINTKAVIMLSTEKVKQGIKSMNDPSLMTQFEEWQGIKEQIAKLYGQRDESQSIDSLVNVANIYEKELTRKSSAFASQYIRKKYSWLDVQKALKPNEAAVEVIRFTNYNPENGGAFTNEIRYAFLVVTTQTKTQPDIILLNNGNELESKFMNFYRNSIRFQQEDPYSYKNYFESLADYLQKNKIQKVYLSSEGVYNQINLNSIRNPFTQKYILDEYDVHLLNNTRELASNMPDKRVGQAPVLLGFPKFNLEETGNKKVAETRGATRSITRGGITRGFRGGLLRYMRGEEDGISVLPGTEKEINEISVLFQDKPHVFMESQAAEHTIKEVNNPRVLHIATHGYFLEDEAPATEATQSQYVANPLLKAGLILAGAENFLLTGNLNESGDDGILTAYEAMNLNLDDTDLVVLSACETGLGQVKNGEGVYGLQRAFRLAGTKNIVMSLWSVDDEATQELMSLFYKEMLGGKTQHEAFRVAQQQLKLKFKQPFYWGAFIMVGE